MLNRIRHRKTAQFALPGELNDSVLQAFLVAAVLK
jgi:hypothetical protein